jgi:hypothetical protein
MYSCHAPGPTGDIGSGLPVLLLCAAILKGFDKKVAEK